MYCVPKSPYGGPNSTLPTGGESIINVLLVSRDAHFRRAVRQLCAEAGEVHVALESPSVQGAVRDPPLQPVHVVLVETQEPESPEAESARAFLQEPWQASLVLVTPQETSSFIVAAIEMGASGLFSRETPLEYLISTIHRVHAGEQPIQYNLLNSPAAASHLLTHLRAHLPPVASGGLGPLSGRDIETLTLVAQGYSNKEIAHQLWVSEQTVKNRVTTILRKIQARDRAQAAVLALRKGWIQPE